MSEVPQILFVQPSHREFICNEYPEIKKFVSDTFRLDETTIIIGDSSTSYVDKKGILYIHPKLFSHYKRFIFNFFSRINSGKSIKESTEELLQNIERDLDDKIGINIGV